MQPFFTIGHSTRTLDEFISLLSEAGVRHLVDVRTVPRSRTNPQFNRDTLPDALAALGLSYEHLESLGGLRGKSKTVPPDTNAFWHNDSFHHYADYALSADFRAGLAQLIEYGHTTPSAIMCAEAVWWRCHRRIIADYLLTRQETVFHIMGTGHIDPAHLTEGAMPQPNGQVLYPRLAH